MFQYLIYTKIKILKKQHQIDKENKLVYNTSNNNKWVMTQ